VLRVTPFCSSKRSNEIHLLVVDDKNIVTKFIMNGLQGSRILALIILKEEKTRLEIDGNYKYTVWCSNFIKSDPNQILIGGDDCIMSFYNLQDSDPPKLICMDSK
jgi:hypothetical protein